MMVDRETTRMPRKSLFSIELAADEEEILSARSRQYTLPYFQVQRVKMILLAAQGMENDEIAET
jgi:hypothetical protein